MPIVVRYALQTYLDDCGVDTFVIDFTSNCALVYEEFVDDTIKVYPNPFKSDFNVNIPKLTSENITIKVYDMLGKTIKTINLSATELQNLKLGKNYKSGIYNVLLEQGTNFQTLRVIKE